MVYILIGTSLTLPTDVCYMHCVTFRDAPVHVYTHVITAVYTGLVYCLVIALPVLVFSLLVQNSTGADGRAIHSISSCGRLGLFAIALYIHVM